MSRKLPADDVSRRQEWKQLFRAIWDRIEPRPTSESLAEAAGIAAQRSRRNMRPLTLERLNHYRSAKSARVPRQRTELQCILEALADLRPSGRGSFLTDVERRSLFTLLGFPDEPNLLRRHFADSQGVSMVFLRQMLLGHPTSVNMYEYIALTRMCRFGRSGIPTDDNHSDEWQNLVHQDIASPLGNDALRRVADLGPSNSSIQFARMLRLIATGVSHGLKLTTLIDPRLSSFQVPRDRVQDPEVGDPATPAELARRARYRIATLLSAGDHEGGSILNFDDSHDHDARSLAYLCRANSLFESDPDKAEAALDLLDPSALPSAEKHINVYQATDHPHDPVDDVTLQALLSLPIRFLVERFQKPERIPPKAFLWLQAPGDPEEMLGESLHELDPIRSRTLSELCDARIKAAASSP